MKKHLASFFSFFACIAINSQTPCSGGAGGVGTASGFPCKNIDLYAHLNISELGGSAGIEGNDIWGWTDPLNGKEYAIIGLTSHTAFVDISNPINPIYLGKLPTATTNSIWRDVKVYNNYAFIVSEASNHGMQVFDLTRLRNVVAPPLTFTSDAHYTGFGKAHNIAINEATGFAYAIGTSTFSGGPHFINIQNPLTPVAAGGYSAQNYTHDAQIVIYNGPDTEHVGKEIFFGANENKVVVVDVTNKTNPILLSTFTYTNADYVHQGWLTEDHKYFMLGDELDETAFGFNTKTVIIDMSNLDAPILKSNYFGTTAAIDHNGYTLNNEFYLANYRAGFRLMDMSDIENGNMTEVGFFDTYPASNSNSFNGAWSVYPYFASGSIIISDIESGLFVVKKNAFLGSENFATNSLAEINVFPNPANDVINIVSSTKIEKVELYNILGESLVNVNNLSLNEYKMDLSRFSKGVYFIKINNAIIKKIIVK